MRRKKTQAFVALTERNSINGTLCVESTGGMKRSKKTSEHAFNAANQAKVALMDASLSSGEGETLGLVTRFAEDPFKESLKVAKEIVARWLRTGFFV